MVYLLAILLLVGIGAIIRALTADRGPAAGRPSEDEAARTAEAVDDLMERSLAAQARGLQRLADRPGVPPVLAELFQRLGLTPDQIQTQMTRLGLAVPEHEVSGKAEGRPFGLVVSGRRDLLNEALERALLVGIHIARDDDDYAGVGDDRADHEALAQRAEAAEEALFGSGRREAYALVSKVVLVLQDMLQDAPGERRADVIRNLLAVFGGRLEALQEEMAAAMARVPDSGTLKWGDSRDRRQYYFKMGVTNALRRSGCLESLGRLYWLRGVNYDVTEAYDMAARECPVLASAHLMDIDRLLALGPAEVRAMVDRALPEQT